MARETPQAKINLDSVLSQFDSWQMTMVGLQTTRTSLIERLESLQKENHDLQQKNLKHQKEVVDMQEMISKVHNELNHVCNLEVEVKALKAAILSKDLAMNDQKETMINVKSEHSCVVAELKQMHQEEQNSEVQKAQTQAQIQLDDLKDLLKEKDHCVQSLEEKLQLAECDKQAEIVRLTMEYEGKINKIQRQKSQNFSTQSSVATQDIFRKKLQFMKAESEKEINDLKRTVSDLQQRITILQREPAKLSLSMGKKRRY